MTEVVPRNRGIVAAHEDHESPHGTTEDNLNCHQFEEGDDQVEDCSKNPAEVDCQGNLRYCPLARFRFSTNSVPRLGPSTSSHIGLLCVEGGKGFLLLAIGHLEVIK